MTTTTTPDPPTATASTPKRATSKAKPASAKAKAGSGATGKAKATTAVAKATVRKVSQPRKDAPRTGDMTGAVLDGYQRAVAATPKGKENALNANRIAAALSEKAGKTVWPVPTKKHLETAVVRGDVVKVANGKDGGRYYRK